MLSKLGILLLICMEVGVVMAQEPSLQSDLRALAEKRLPRPSYLVKRESPPAPVELEQVSELSLLLAIGLRVYQATFSAMDTDRCNFTPSCSRFSAAVVKEVGPIRGVLLSADRLTRDHGLPGLHRHYHVEPVYRKFADPVSRYVPPELNLD